MQEPSFWEAILKAQEITQEAKFIRDKLARYRNLEIALEDVEIIIELTGKEEENSIYNDIIVEIKHITDEIEKFRIEILLSAGYDRNNAIVTLHAGVGGTDLKIGLKCFSACTLDGVIKSVTR